MAHATEAPMHITKKRTTIGISLFLFIMYGPLESSGQEEPITEPPAKKFQLPGDLKWQTNDNDPIFADPRAQKGGTLQEYMIDYPATFRQHGPNSNSFFSIILSRYEMSLLALHTGTGNHIPALATHWAVASDHKTVYYKLNPNARWSDGRPVTAEDYLFTLEFKRSPHIVSPWHNNHYTEEITHITKHSDDVISVVSGKKRIDFNLLRKTNISPTPKHFYKLDKNWVHNYTWKIKPNLGAYQIKNYKHGKFITFARKKDWWAQDLKYFKYRYNPDVIQYKVIRDPEARWQNFLKGELTLYGASLPSFWYDKSQAEPFQKGYIKKHWFYHQKPKAAQGLWLNTQKDPWKDVNVRRGFAHAINFKKVNEEILRGEQKRLSSFHEGYGKYSDPSIKARTFNIEQAAQYMKNSGWSLGNSGVWEKADQAIQISITYGNPLLEPQLVVLKEEAKKAGFNIELEKLDWTAYYKKIMEKNHQIALVSYHNSKVPPPAYWQFLHSEQAIPQSNNLSMIKDPELDKLIDVYRETFDVEKKMTLSRQILKKHHEIGAFIPGNYASFWKIFYWNSWKFPQVAGTRINDQADISLIWFDPQAEQKLQDYKKSGQSFDASEIIDTTFK